MQEPSFFCKHDIGRQIYSRERIISEVKSYLNNPVVWNCNIILGNQISDGLYTDF